MQLAEVQLWLSLARCTAVLDELTILELSYLTDTAPDRVDGRRLSLNTSRQLDHEELQQGIRGLVHRMDAAAAMANQHKVLQTPAAITSIDAARGVVKRFSDPLGIEVDWDP